MYHKLGNAPVPRSRTVSWFLSSQLGAHDPFNPVIRLGLQNQRKKTRKFLKKQVGDWWSRQKGVIAEGIPNFASFLQPLILGQRIISFQQKLYSQGSIHHVKILTQARILWELISESRNPPKTDHTVTGAR